LNYVAFVAEGHSRDSMLQPINPVHAHYPTIFYREIALALQELGLKAHTRDVLQEKGIEPLAELYFESQEVSDEKIPRVLIAMENPQINPLNISKSYVEGFTKVLSWNRELAYLPAFEFLAYVPLESLVPSDERSCDRSKLATMICSNKVFKTPVQGDLYLKRLEVLEWFEKNSPEEFELFGQGWAKPPHEQTISKKIQRAGRRLKSILTSRPCYLTWRGSLHSKRDAYLNAWYGFCYENSSLNNGYVTEKILDAMAVGVVPIYLGAPDVKDYIPEELFIDARQFDSVADLVSFCRALPVERRLEMIQGGHEFIYNSPMFSLKTNVSVVANAIAGAISSSHVH